MSGVTPTTGPPPANSGGSGNQQQNAAPSQDDAQKQNQAPQGHHRPAVSLSASLAPLAEGMRVDARLAGQDMDGFPLIRSANGSFVIVSDTESLPPNSRLVLQILNVGTSVRAAILSANGQPLHPPLQVTLELTRAAPPLPAADHTARTGNHSVQTTYGAIAGGEPVTDQPSRLAPGSPLVAKLIASATGKPLPTAANSDGPTYLLRVSTIGSGARTVGSPVTAAKADAQPTPGAGPSPSAAFAPGARAAAGTGVPGYTVVQQATVSQPRLNGMIVGKSQSGQLLFRSPAGLMALQSNANLPPGTALTAEIVSRTQPAEQTPFVHREALARTPATLAGLLSHDRSWPDLKETFEVLRALEPALAAQMAAKAMPMPNKRLTSTLLFFFSALKAGNFRQWLGDNVLQALERAGRRDLLLRLEDDFGQVSRLAGETGGGDWRTLLLPLYDGHDLHQLMLFYRHHGRKDGDQDGEEESTRFVLNLVLSSLGPMQLDGLVQDKRFNLFVRSKQPLAKTVQQDLSTLFNEGLDATDWSGTLAFQVGGQFPVEPLEEVVQQEKHGDGVVV